MPKRLFFSIKTSCVLVMGLLLLAGCGGSGGSTSTAIATGSSSGASVPATSNSAGSSPSSASSTSTASSPPTSPTAPTGSASLSWTAPATNTDGSALTDLAGYRIYYGTSSTGLTQTVDVPSASATSYVLQSLASGTWYFAISAVTNSGSESARSGVVSKTIG